jgi:hypothetical protein
MFALNVPHGPTWRLGMRAARSNLSGKAHETSKKKRPQRAGAL